MKMKKPNYITTALAAIALLNGNIQTGFSTGDQKNTVHLRTEIDQSVLWRNEKENQKVIIRIELEGAEVEKQSKRTPLNLAVVLDRSGSMSGPKLRQAKQAAHMLVDQLDKGDVFSLVMYDTEVEVLIPAQKLGNQRKRFQQIIEKIRSGGSTALYHGVESGGKQLQEYLSSKRINRVILLSDGIANVGPSSNREIAKLGQRLARKDVSVTTIGLGDDYNENLMTALAEASDANYYYVADVEDLPNVFSKELGELKSLVARNIVIEIECPKGVRPLRFLGRPEKLSSQHEKIEFKTLASEQSRYVFLECEIDSSVNGDISEIAQIALKFEDSSDEVQKTSQAVVVGYANDRTLVAKSRNETLIAEASVYANAVETEKAIALADKGDISAAQVQLQTQSVTLKKAWAVAPAAQKAELAKEIEAVEEAESDLKDNAQFSKSQRKKLQSGAYSLRNSKR